MFHSGKLRLKCGHAFISRASFTFILFSFLLATCHVEATRPIDYIINFLIL